MAVAIVIDEVEEQRERLLYRLADQRRHVRELWAWYRGKQTLPDVPAKYADAYTLFLNHSITPWARLVVDALVERLRVQGFRSGDNAEAARMAWAGFIRSRLNADQRLVYIDAAVGGTGYVSVARAASGEVYVVPESAQEVTHEPDLTDRATVAGALKLYPLDYSLLRWVCELYRPEATHRWLGTLDAPLRDPEAFPIDERRWTFDSLGWEPIGVEPNPAGLVPIIPFENRLSPLMGGMSEIVDLIPVLQRIDRLTLDKMLTSYYGSFRQKWATGLLVDRDPQSGERANPYRAAQDRLWVNPSPDGKFGDFNATDITQYLSAVDSEIATLAAISRVPSHFLLQRNLANPPSAESLIAAETGLVAKAVDRQASYGEAWEQAFTLHARLSGQPIEIDTLEVQWVDAEKRNPATVADAAVKLRAIGVPESALWAYAGFTPAQVEEFTAEQAASALLAAAVATAGGELPPVAEAVEAVAAEVPQPGGAA
jgi:hypothetical protein